MAAQFTNPNYESHPYRQGKTSPPLGWVVAETPVRHLMFTTIPVKQVLVDWSWQNRHAVPIFGYFIPDKPEFIFRDKCLAKYYDRLDDLSRENNSLRRNKYHEPSEYDIESAREQLPLLCKERQANLCGCSRRKSLNSMIRSAASILGLTVPMEQDKYHAFIKERAEQC